jgi:hypothetical protein
MARHERHPGCGLYEEACTCSVTGLSAKLVVRSPLQAVHSLLDAVQLYT